MELSSDDRPDRPERPARLGSLSSWKCITTLTVALFLLLETAACASQRPAHTPAILSRWHWVIDVGDFAHIEKAAPELAAGLLSSPATFAVGKPGGKPFPQGTVPTRLFTSYSAFLQELRTGRLSPRVRAVAYDPEAWQATPIDEQRDPLRYMALFARTARHKGYHALLMPGRDLLLVPGAKCGKRQGETLDSAYVRCGIARAARFAPVFEIQAAPVETDVPELRSFVRAAARRAHAANPSVTLTATLSTAPPGGASVSAAALVRAAAAIMPYVGGFQLNMTSGTRGVAVTFLRLLSGARQRPG